MSGIDIMSGEISRIIADELLDLSFGGLPISASLKIISLVLSNECVNQRCPCEKRDCPKIELVPVEKDDSGLVNGFEEFEDLAYHIDGLEVGCECCESSIDINDAISNWIKDNGYESTN